MKPIEMTVRCLRRMALSASSDRTRNHICSVRFRNADMVATNGALLVLAPLPIDDDRNFSLSAHGALEATAEWRLDAHVGITRRISSTVLSTPGKDCVLGATIMDGQDLAFPPVEQVMTRGECGAVTDLRLGPRMLITVGRVARDVGVYAPPGRYGWDMGTSTRVVHVGIPNGPVHFSFNTEHGIATILAMPTSA